MVIQHTQILRLVLWCLAHNSITGAQVKIQLLLADDSLLIDGNDLFQQTDDLCLFKRRLLGSCSAVSEFVRHEYRVCVHELRILAAQDDGDGVAQNIGERVVSLGRENIAETFG